MLTFVVAILVGYLLGSVPTSVIAGRLGGVDIRAHGSGNPGATNVLRTLGWLPGLSVLAVDVLKGAAAVWAGGRIGLDDPPFDAAWLPVAAGVAAVIGNVWPVWVAFRGGKGVATALGVTLVLAPLAAGAAVVVFFAAVVVTRRVSVGSLAGAVTFAIALVVVDAVAGPVPIPTFAFGGWFVLAVFWTHRSNLRKLMAGTEPPMRWGKRA